MKYERKNKNFGNKKNMYPRICVNYNTLKLNMTFLLQSAGYKSPLQRSGSTRRRRSPSNDPSRPGRSGGGRSTSFTRTTGRGNSFSRKASDTEDTDRSTLATDRSTSTTDQSTSSLSTQIVRKSRTTSRLVSHQISSYCFFICKSAM